MTQAPPGEELEKRYKAVTKLSRDPQQHGKARAELGSFQLELGLAHGGLDNILRAVLGEGAGWADFDGYIGSNKLPSDPRLVAQLGEALRVYARDELLSRADSIDTVDTYTRRSIECFEKAREDYAKEYTPLAAWVTAHRAAGYTTRFWLSTIPGLRQRFESEAPRGFEEADAGFRRAVAMYAVAQGASKTSEEREQDIKAILAKGDDWFQEKPVKDILRKETEGAGARWAMRFLAFLYTLRGNGPARDFKRAQALLRHVAEQREQADSSIMRSVALLETFQAVAPDSNGDWAATEAGNCKDERAKAAKEAFNQALGATRADHEEFFAAYTGAVTAWLLSHTTGGEAYGDSLKALVQAARVRSTNAISQAHACMLGLALLEAMEAERKLAKGNLLRDELLRLSDVRANAIRAALQVLQQLESAPLDLETQSLILRDPIWQTLRSDDAFREIRTLLLPLFESLRARIVPERSRVEYRRAAGKI